MEIIIQPTAREAAGIAARIIARLLREKPDAVLGLATGSTPLSLYQMLIDMNLDWSRVTTFNLDEYIGLPREHPQTYHSFMWNNLFSHVNIHPENVHIPDGNAADVPAFCAAYEERILAAGGIDLQVLGIGENKAAAVAGMVEGPITAINPASVLQLHPVAKVCLDAPAASKLQRADYFRWVYDNKPAWQVF